MVLHNKDHNFPVLLKCCLTDNLYSSNTPQCQDNPSLHNAAHCQNNPLLTNPSTCQDNLKLAIIVQTTILLTTPVHYHDNPRPPNAVHC